LFEELDGEPAGVFELAFEPPPDVVEGTELEPLGVVGVTGVDGLFGLAGFVGFVGFDGV
jgi:hypothetical protein